MMDSCLARYAERKLREDGWYADYCSEGWFWIKSNDPRGIPVSLRGATFSDFPEALEALCRELLPPSLVGLVDANNEFYRADTDAKTKHSEERLSAAIQAIYDAIEPYVNGATYATSSSGST